jgi:hypothetical protein
MHMLHRAKGVKLLPYLVDTLPEQDDAVRRIQAPDEPYPEEVWFEPEFIIRESTAAIQTASPRKSRQSKR